jgi:GPH family glycoside/pentoside/hexuronide:cation symporter
MVGSFVLLLNPLITETSRGNSLYLISLLGMFYLALALYQVPYLAWLPELAPQDHQRIVLSSWLAVATLLGTIAGGVGTPWLSAQYGFAAMTAIMGMGSLVMLLLPLLTPELAAEKTERLPLFTVLQASWQNSSFRSYVMGISAAWAAMAILAVCPPFFAIALLHKDIGFGAMITALVMGGSACGMTITRPLVRRCGKRGTFRLAMVWTGSGLVLLAISSAWLGAPLTLWVLIISFSSLGLGCFMILPNAMMPDVIEQDLKLGKSAQAAYFGSRGLFRELSIGVGTLLVGLLLSLGNTAANPLGVQLSLLAAGIFVLISAGFWTIYPIAK